MARKGNRPTLDVLTAFQPAPEQEGKLRPKHYAVLEKYATHGSTYKGIAAAMGLPIGTVKSRLHRARASLSTLKEASAQ